MPNPKPSNEFRNVSVLARGPVLRAILYRAEQRSISLGKAALSLIEDRIGGAPAAPILPPQQAASSLVNLERVDTDDLIDELVGRLVQIKDAEAAIKRAELAEAKLLQVAEVLAPAKQQKQGA